MRVDAKRCAGLLQGSDRILLLCHHDPDGDTLGSAFGLMHALLSLGKCVRVECDSPFPTNLDFLYKDTLWDMDFPPEVIAAIDVASPVMLGSLETKYPQIDLCIDHHPTNPGYAKETLLSNAAATGEAVMDVIREMGCTIQPDAATALLTALCSDTGGFRYSNTTSSTLRKAADLIDAGANYAIIRERLFESKSRGLVMVEAYAMQHLSYYAGGKIAVLKISQEVMEKAQIREEELEGISALPREIEGVEVGITLKEKPDGMVRVSIRTASTADASAICGKFGGGGHKRAAGCRMRCTLAEAEKKLAAAAQEVL